jgi:hypothetical protein
MEGLEYPAISKASLRSLSIWQKNGLIGLNVWSKGIIEQDERSADGR